MATNAEHPPSIATELIFVNAYHNLPDISEAEWIDYYAPPEFNGLRDDLKTHIEWQLDLFSDEDYFSAAEYVESAHGQGLQLRLPDSADGLIDAVQVNIHSLVHGRFRQAKAVFEAGLIGMGGKQHAEFFAAQRHERQGRPAASVCQIPQFVPQNRFPLRRALPGLNSPHGVAGRFQQH